MIDIVKQNWEVIAVVVLAIYEIVARRIPTTGNWSMIHLGIQVLDIVVKNQAKTDEREMSGKPVKKSFKLRKTRR